MHRVVKVAALPQYRLQVEFDDGVSGVVEIFPRLSGPVFEPLRDEALFRRVAIDEETGAVCWPNGPDLAPDAMYARLSGQPIFADRAESNERTTSPRPQTAASD
jgi:hypothetical protein